MTRSARWRNCAASSEGNVLEAREMVESVVRDGQALAIILRTGYKAPGIQFFTPDDFSQQMAYMNHPSGYAIAPHVHNAVSREVQFTKEVLFIKSGRVRVDFYDEAQTYIESRVLEAGDVILLARGGHGFEMLDDCEMIEVKQGPYAGDADKTRFESVAGHLVSIRSGGGS